MTDHLTHTIIPWVLGCLIILVTVSGLLTIRFWRESKRSPYYFLRRQAEQNMQTYSLATLGLLVTTIFVVTYAWQGTQENVSRVALIANAKPIEVVELPVLLEEEQEVAEVSSPSQVVVINGASSAEILLNLAAQQGLNTAVAVSSEAAGEFDRFSLDDTLVEASAVPLQDLEILPEEFNLFEPEVQISDNTNIGTLSFSTDVDDDLQAIDARRLFEEGFFTLYATFDYAEMADGMEWSWVWRRDGEIVSGGNELWSYGDEGPGYVYLNPQEGFKAGQYTVQIWVNDELMTQSNLFITTDVAFNN